MTYHHSNMTTKRQSPAWAAVCVVNLRGRGMRHQTRILGKARGPCRG